MPHHNPRQLKHINMKAKTLILPAALLLLATGCDKSKTCRCSVLDSNDVRIIKIEKGECTDLKVYHHHTDVDTLVVDSLLCTDYEFRIDSIYNQQ